MQAKNKELVLSIQGVPWKLSPAESPGTLDDIPTMIATEAIVEEDELPPPPPAPIGERSGKRRRVYIRRDIELDKYGYTDNCVGCIAARAGLQPRVHSAECRARIIARMEDEIVKRTSPSRRRKNGSRVTAAGGSCS